MVSGLLTPKETWKALNWKMTLFIVGMLILSQGLETSGASELLANQIVNILGEDMGERTFLAILFIFSAVLTQFLNNTAQTAMLIPIVMPLATAYGMNPVGALMTITIGSSSSFASPFGTPANMMVTDPGNIKFVDWLKIGIPLVIIALIVVVVVVQ